MNAYKCDVCKRLFEYHSKSQTTFFDNVGFILTTKYNNDICRTCFKGAAMGILNQLARQEDTHDTHNH